MVLVTVRIYILIGWRVDSFLYLDDFFDVFLRKFFRRLDKTLADKEPTHTHK